MRWKNRSAWVLPRTMARALCADMSVTDINAQEVLIANAVNTWRDVGVLPRTMAHSYFRFEGAAIMTPPPKKRLGTVKQACAEGLIGKTELYRRIGLGEIKAYKRGDKTLIDLDSVVALNESLPPWQPKNAR
jgi:hypothetical protein